MLASLATAFAYFTVIALLFAWAMMPWLISYFLFRDQGEDIVGWSGVLIAFVWFPAVGIACRFMF